MNNPLNITSLNRLMEISEGDNNIVIGLIDGPVKLDHPAFLESNIKTLTQDQYLNCKNSSSLACMHGTFIAGILSSKRGLPSPAICPKCTLLVHPVFMEAPNSNKNEFNIPSTTPELLSNAILETINAGAKIINLSLNLLDTHNLLHIKPLYEIYQYAAKKDILIVNAAVNNGYIGQTSLPHWIIPVTSCSESGNISTQTNIGPTIGTRGLMAPGINITSTAASGGYNTSSGNSIAAAFVTGTLALLWSIFPTKNASELKHSILRQNKRTIIPPLLDAYTAFQILKNN